jgi:hypothetical protein
LSVRVDFREDAVIARGTGKRTYETEQKVANRTGLKIENMAKDRIEWPQFVSTLCAGGSDWIDDDTVIEKLQWKDVQCVNKLKVILNMQGGRPG